MKYVAKHGVWVALAVAGLGATAALKPALAQTPLDQILQQQQQQAEQQRQAAQTVQDEQQRQQLWYQEQQRQAAFQQQQQLQQQQFQQSQRFGQRYGYYDQYGCPPGTGYSIFLGRCGDMSEFFTQFGGR